MLALSSQAACCLEIPSSPPAAVDFALSEALFQGEDETLTALYTLLAETLPKLVSTLFALIPDNPWLSHAQNKEQLLELSIVLVTNSEIHALNQTYRSKDQATDVLTFNLLTANQQPQVMPLPMLALGEVYVSYDWAKAEVCKHPEQKVNFFPDLSLYIMERMTHGCLHLLGVHHDTLADYNTVVAIQQKVLQTIAPKVNLTQSS